MNLTLHDGEDGPEIDLWQTPTYITWMCLSYDPETKESDGGQQGVRRRYIYWLESHVNGVWEDADDLKYMKEKIKTHIETLLLVKNPNFSFI